jgi:hypothetical protein
MRYYIQTLGAAPKRPSRSPYAAVRALLDNPDRAGEYYDLGAGYYATNMGDTPRARAAFIVDEVANSAARGGYSAERKLKPLLQYAKAKRWTEVLEAYKAGARMGAQFRARSLPEEQAGAARYAAMLRERPELLNRG